MKTLITNANVVLPNETVKTNVLISDGLIASVHADAATRADEAIDASGLTLMPGVIDDQVHFRDPGFTEKEDLYTGSRACAKGGITTFLEMPNTNPTTTTLEALDTKLAVAAEKCLVNFGFYVGATGDNVDVLQAATRTPGIKIFIGSSTGPLLVDEQAALEDIFRETSLPICAHCEDETTVRNNRAELEKTGIKSYADHSKIRDHNAALIATKRAVDLAERHNHRFHVLHVSTAIEVDFLRGTSDLITAEVCPHHLLFNIDDYDRLGALVQMNPSIKNAVDNAALWRSLLDGVIEVIATDHAPHSLADKQKPYPDSPSGLPAVENSLALMLDAVNSGRISLEKIVSCMCEAPARVWNIRNKGRIKKGFDADLVLVDMNRKQEIRNEDQVTKCGWSPWHGTTLTGWPVRTIVGGRTVYNDGTFDETVRGTEATYNR